MFFLRNNAAHMESVFIFKKYTETDLKLRTAKTLVKA